MSMGERTSLITRSAEVRAPLEKCPYAPQALIFPHVSPVVVPQAEMSLLPPQSHSASLTQTEANWRIARDRSHHKRGPPTA
jgi:hypothetical protein